MTLACESLADPVSAARRVRVWLAAKCEVEYIESPPEGLIYGLDRDEEWVFRIQNPRRPAVGATRYVTVNRITGRLMEHEAGE